MTRRTVDIEVLAERVADPRWRLCESGWYRIVDADGREVEFRPNPTQRRLLSRLHHRNVVLKARQLGMTTAIDLAILDACVWTPHVTAAIIAHRLEDVQRIYQTKVLGPYKRLPADIRAKVPATKQDACQLVLANGSSIRVGLSMRSDTLQMLHVSEYGKICARYPDKAEEIRTGTLPACHRGAVVWIESTAEGRGNDFHRLCQAAQAATAEADRQGRRLGPTEWRFWFFPWYEHDAYRLPDDEVLHVELMAEETAYFDGLEQAQGVTIDLGQRAWYVQARRGPGGLGDLMMREYPSTPDEAFRASVDGAYYGALMARAREEGRIGHVAYDDSLPVYTFWDLGISDSMAIWFAQLVGQEVRLIDYLEDTGKGLPHYVAELRRRPYVYGGHWAPQDIRVRELGTGVSRWETARELGIEFDLVPAHQVPDGIDAARSMLLRCWFDARACRRGIEALEAYRAEWDEKGQCFKPRPVHDWSSHAADAFRYLAVAYRYDRIAGQFHSDPLAAWDSDDARNEYDPLRFDLVET